MLVRALDSETFLIAPGLLAPRMVCATWATSQGAGIGLDTPPAEWFDGPTVFHNSSFDLCVFMAKDPSLVRAIFDALAAGRVHCTMVRQMLADLHDNKFQPNRKGYYTLAGLAQRHLGIKVEKQDTWRLRYHDLADTPIKDWPDDAKSYAITDSKVTLEVFNSQLVHKTRDVYANEAAQVRMHTTLQLMEARGMMLDAPHVLQLKADLEADFAKYQQLLVEHNYARFKGDKVAIREKAVRERVAEVMGADADLTTTGYKKTRDEGWTRAQAAQAGYVKIDADACAAAAARSGDAGLGMFATYKTTQKMLSTYVNHYAEKLTPEYGGTGLGIVQPGFQLLVETGRTSCRNPNVQNLPRDDRFRRCFRARPGYVFIACDFNAAELHTLAQTCLDMLGYSKLADALNAGLDPHLAFAADSLLRIPYEEALRRKELKDPEVKSARQQAKAANFGYPGGLGDNAFRSYAAGYGVHLTLAESIQVREHYDEQWPEVREYHAAIKRFLRRGGSSFMPLAGLLRIPRSNRYRAGVRFTQAANTLFQAPAADGAKEAAFELTRLCFTDVTSPLYGVRPVNFVHDEVISECPEDRAHEAAMEMEKVMAEVFTRTATPDVPCKAEATIMRSWTKADPVWRDGRLIPVEDAA